MLLNVMKRKLRRCGSEPARVATMSLVPWMALLVAPAWGLAQAPGGGQGKSAVPAPPKQGGAAAPAANPQPGASPKAPAALPTPQGAITNDDDPRVKAALARTVAFLKARGNDARVGEVSLSIHALAKIRTKFPDLVAENDPSLLAMVSVLRSHCQNGVFQPSSSGGKDNYEAGCAAMALSAVDGQLYKPEIEAVANYILKKQIPNGSWSYDGSAPGGDTSQTQYAILGLWEAADGAGAAISKSVWDKAANWLVTHQNGDGGFGYHPPDPAANVKAQAESTHTMTCGSLGSLYICRDHLPGGRRKNARGLLLQVQEEDPLGDYKPQVSAEQMNGAIGRATDWLTSHFTLDKPTGESDSGQTRWNYYYLYAFERFATLAGVKQFAGIDWYSKGAEYLLAKQQPDGSWNASDGQIPNTAFAALFLVRSTYVSKLKHERRLARGTLISGKGLPANLSELELEGGRLKQRAKRDKTETLLEIIGQGTAETESAARGLLKQMYTKKWTAVGEEGDKLRKNLQKNMAAKNSDAIIAILRLLSVTGDYRVAPLLIDAMYYEDDEDVQLAAREGLCLLSRRFPGKYAGSTLEDWQAEIDEWKAWYHSVRPEADLDDELEIK